MKKTVFGFVLILGAAVLFSSCLNLAVSLLKNQPETHEIVLDEYSPADQNITLTFAGSFVLKRWNSSDTQGIMYDKGLFNDIDKIILTIPAGNNSFIFDVYYTYSTTTSSTTYRVPNVELSYLLEAGKKYQIKTRSKKLGSRKGYEFFVGIYDATNRSAVQLKEWKIGES